MGQIRVYELAVELGLPTSVVMDKIAELGWPEIRSDAAVLGPEREARLRSMTRRGWDRTRGRWSAARERAVREAARTARVVVRSYDGRPHYDLWPEEPPMTAVAAASRLGVRPATIRQWVARGYLTSVGRCGRAHLYAAADLLRARREVDERTPEVRKPAQDTLLHRRLDELLTTAQAAALARVTPSTIRMWVTRGKLERASATRPNLYTVAAVRRAAAHRLPQPKADDDWPYRASDDWPYRASAIRPSTRP